MNRLKMLSLQEIVTQKSYGKQDRQLMKEQRLATDRKVKVKVKYPLSQYHSYQRYSNWLNKVYGMTDELVAEVERIHRGANAAGVKGEFFNEHTKDFPVKEEASLAWFQTQQRELDEHWFTRWTFGVTPYQRMGLRIKDRVENLNNLKRLNVPRSQPQFVDGVKMQQFHSPQTKSYLNFMRNRQLQDQSKAPHKKKYVNDDFTPLPNIKHENVENDADELLGLVDITKMDFSRIEIAREEIMKMYYYENKVSKKHLNKVRNRLRKESRMLREIRSEGPREYMLKRGLVDLVHDPNFADDVINYHKAEQEQLEAQADNAEEKARQREENQIAWLLQIVKDEKRYSRIMSKKVARNAQLALQQENKPVEEEQEEQEEEHLSTLSDSAKASRAKKLINERISAAFQGIKNPNEEYYTKAELRELIDTILREEKLDILTPEDANAFASKFYPKGERGKLQTDFVDGVVPFPVKRLEATLEKNKLRTEIQALKKTISAFEWKVKDTPGWILKAQEQSRLKRLQDVYALNAKASAERKTFNKNIWVSDTSKVPDEYSPEDFGLLYQIPLKDFRKVMGRAIQRQQVAKQIYKSSSRTLCLMVREQIMDILPEADRVLYNQYAETGERNNRGFVFTGGAGTGKTCVLLQAIHHCYRKGFLIFHIPNGHHWAKGPHYVEPSSVLPGYFDAPEPTLEFLKSFFKTNSHILGRIRLTQHYGLGEKGTKLQTMYDLVSYAIDRGLDEVGVHFKLVLDELSLNKTIPMLFAVDEYNHFTDVSGFKYGNLLRFTEVEPTPVHTNQFVLHRALNRMLLDNDRNKLFVCANSDTHPYGKKINLEQMILTPIDVPRYNEKEMRTMMHYYCANHFTNRPTEEYIHSARFLSGGIGKELFKEVTRETF